MSTETRDNAIRDAKRYIREIVRNDWTFDPSTSRLPSTPPDREVTEWRVRAYDSSGSELEPEPDPEPSSAIQEDPASGSEESAEVAVVDRRRKRRRQMEEEMQWNEGLRTWVERRDAWAGARTRSVLRPKMKGRIVGLGKGVVPMGSTGPTSAAATGVKDGVVDGKRARSSSSGSTDSSPVSPKNKSKAKKDEGIATRTESMTLADADKAEKAEASPHESEAEPDNNEQAVSTEESSESDGEAPSSPDEGEETDDEPLIPVVPSIISVTNPIRAAITQSMYPSIYTKVVVQGLTPTVPINLADVTRAMIQGWKSDGQWPPKPATTNLVLPDDATVPKKASVSGTGDSVQTKRRSSGVANAVKKVFHFSGIHGHHFHRRASSQSQNHDQNDGQTAESRPQLPPDIFEKPEK